MTALEVAAAVPMLAGSALVLLAGLGLQQFADVFARIHAATKAITLGLLLVVVGAALTIGELGASTKLLLVVVLQFVTAPVAAHIVGRAAYRSGSELSPDTVVDELAELEPRRPRDHA